MDGSKFVIQQANVWTHAEKLDRLRGKKK